MTLKTVRMCDMNNGACSNPATGDPCRLCARDYCGAYKHTADLLDITIRPSIITHDPSSDYITAFEHKTATRSESATEFERKFYICSECGALVKQATKLMDDKVFKELTIFVDKYVQILKTEIAALLLKEKENGD